SRRGVKKAHVAVAASILTAAYHILRDDVPFNDLGDDYFDRRNKTRTTNRLLKRLHNLGYTVEVKIASCVSSQDPGFKPAVIILVFSRLLRRLVRKFSRRILLKT